MSIVIEDSYNPKLEYQFSWYETEENKFNSSGWTGWVDTDTAPSQSLDKIYTNYYVDVRYKEDDNHNASIAVRGESVIVYTGSVIFKISADSQSLIHNEVIGGQNQSGITVTLVPQNGYYIYNIEHTIAIDGYDGYVLPKLNNLTTTNTEWIVWIHDIQDSTNGTVTVKVHFAGAEKKATVGSSVIKDEVFTAIENSTADVKISNDSAYTVLFDINNFNHYINPAINFSSDLPVGTTIIMLDRANNTYWSYKVSAKTSKVLLENFVRMGSTSGDKFVVDGKTTLSLQFVVDFSDCANSLAAGNFTTSFVATPVQPTGLNTVPAMPAGNSDVTIVSAPSFNLSQGTSGTDGDLKQSVDYIYGYIADSTVGISKWDDRYGLLVITPTDLSKLPQDARLQVKIGDSTSTVYLVNGKFVVDLPSVGTGTAEITLLSDMLPNDNVEYAFNVKLYASNTKVKTTSDVEVSSSIVTLKYNVTKVETVSVNAAVKGNIPKFDGTNMGVLNFNVSISGGALPSGYKLKGSLYAKNSTGGYTSTTQRVDIVVGDNVLSLDAFKEGMEKEIGSLSLMINIELVDSNGKTVDSQPLYFVLIDTRQ